MNEPIEKLKYLCFKPNRGFAQYSSDSGAISFTQNVEAAHEATKADWSDVIGLDLIDFQFIPANITIHALTTAVESVAKERDELKVELLNILRAHDLKDARLEEISIAIEGYIDGVPDRSEISSLANNISRIISTAPSLENKYDRATLIVERDNLVAQLNLSTPYLRTAYYEKQIHDQTKWAEAVIADPTKTDSQKLENLKHTIIYWAGCYVHGANLASVILERDNLQREKETLSKAAVGCAEKWATLGQHLEGSLRAMFRDGRFANKKEQQ